MALFLRSVQIATMCLFALISQINFVHAETVLKWASAGGALTLDPHGQNEGPTYTLNRQLYEPLIDRTPEQKLVPGLAISWIMRDKETWDFKLREDVVFHDGTPFTAEDVVFSLRRAAHENSDYKTFLKDVTDIQALDDYTVRISTQTPTPLLGANLTQILMMSKAWSETHDTLVPQRFAQGEENYAVRNANGTGPFSLELRQQDIRTRLIRHEDWWGLTEHPHNIDAIEYQPITNSSTRVAAILSGEVDFVLDPPLQDLARIEAMPGLQVSRTPEMRTIFFGLDQARSELRTSDIKGRNPFSDIRVRQAMYQAIDVNAIKLKIMRGNAIPAGLLTAPGVHGWSETLDERIPYNVKEAQRLIEEAGYPNGFSVKLDCPNDRYINDEAICQAVVGMLAKINIRVSLDSQPKALHFPKIENQETDFFMLGWGVPTVDSEYVFNFLYRTNAEWNAGGYSNPALDELIDAMTRETIPSVRDALIEQAWQLAKADIVYLPIHHQTLAWAMSKSLTLPIDSNNSPQFEYANFE